MAGKEGCAKSIDNLKDIHINDMKDLRDMKREIIGIPIGDPAGIGPEIAVKSLSDSEIFKICKPLLIGDICILEKISRILGIGVRFNRIMKACDGLYEYGTVDVVQPGCDDGDRSGDEGLNRLEYGKVQAEAGMAAFRYIRKSAEMAMSGEIAAMATTPINKEAIRAAEIDFIGHTEMLAALSGTEDPLTMFQVYKMRVFFLSRHVSLRKACDMVTAGRLESYIIRCSDALKRLGLDRKHMAVAGLNPHNGEHGLFGDEEGREIEPAIAAAVAKGVDVTGPVPADSVFHQALQGKYDAVLSLYHDQGHIATKTVDFEKTISLTLGMPFLRTSVDHGTAFDIAGKGLASAVSMKEAIRLAAEYCGSYR